MVGCWLLVVGGGLASLAARSGVLDRFTNSNLRPATRNLHPANMIILIDNSDSFTYNLVQKLGEVDRKNPIKVFRNDKVKVEQIEELKPTHIVISPGPCTPKEGGISNDVIKH